MSLFGEKPQRAFYTHVFLFKYQHFRKHHNFLEECAARYLTESNFLKLDIINRIILKLKKKNKHRYGRMLPLSKTGIN